jgi:hypothetical protein
MLLLFSQVALTKQLECCKELTLSLPSPFSQDADAEIMEELLKNMVIAGGEEEGQIDAS